VRLYAEPSLARDHANTRKLGSPSWHPGRNPLL
jgi:hypothetical protein